MDSCKHACMYNNNKNFKMHIKAKEDTQKFIFNII